ncbi:hypothetical protein [Fictibacillus barbaricus]|uniref:Heme/copper-type cytochrome/quinol oxidase subunit 2 n=1 Tax=Fictibacillus barbaricus TaxID=182136 RepID=A0ABU1U253_9BACL|nr:hypothetical protein [Fictibacillus barbaricus]MDR7073562.1 heme/copper-type cytochrome/quinol oxidase subunit 2 [Fictibacillus barbaricus]
MWWLLILVIVILVLVLAFIIDFRRKKRRNDKHTNGVDPSIRQGKYGGDWNSGDGPNGF